MYISVFTHGCIRQRYTHTQIYREHCTEIQNRKKKKDQKKQKKKSCRVGEFSPSNVGWVPIDMKTKACSATTKRPFFHFFEEKRPFRAGQLKRSIMIRALFEKSKVIIG
eukprot:Pompholyxophrys_punicea_v1_NODE_714_length_1406_cov_3.335307.p2 type:complete len:109 gc:universal NODE_714_length_1406_cov_3.335307:923-597(-)